MRTLGYRVVPGKSHCKSDAEFALYNVVVDSFLERFAPLIQPYR